jgi:hypothetical protein
MEKNRAEKALDAIEARYPKEFTCINCNATKSAKLFRYIISRAKAEASGYFNHDVHPKKAMSKLCDVCNPDFIRPDKIPHMTRGQLEQHLLDNRITRAEFDAEMAVRQNPVLRPNKKQQVGELRSWRAHEERWVWLRGRLWDDHRRARSDVWRHDTGVRELPYDQYNLAKKLMEYTSLLIKRVTQCKRARMSSTEGVPTLAQMLGSRRSEELMELWAEHGAAITPHRFGRMRVTPFIITQMRRMALDGAPAYWTETRHDKKGAEE